MAGDTIILSGFTGRATGDTLQVALAKANDTNASFLLHVGNTSNPHQVTYAQIGAAPLASPAFTGNPTAPTPASGDNSTALATTAFVHANSVQAGSSGMLAASGTLTFSGDASGSGTSLIVLTLASVGSAGTYNAVVTDAKGRVSSGSFVPYLTTNQNVVVSGDVSGSGSTAISLVLSAVGTSGTYNLVTTDAKGRVTLGSLVPYLTANQSITLSGDASGAGSTLIPLTLAPSGIAAGTYTQVAVDAKGRAVGGANPTTTLAASGDASGSASFLVGAAGTLALTLAAVGTPGTYNSVVADAKGRIASGTMLPYLLGNQVITVSGDASGSGSTSIALVLASTGIPAGTYSTVVVDAKGRALSGGNPSTGLAASGDASGSTSFVVGGSASLALALASVGSAGTYNLVTTDAKGRVTSGTSVAYLTANQTITLTGDASGTGSTTVAVLLAPTGITAGTYSAVSLDAKGRALAGFNPATSLTASGDATGSASFPVGGAATLGLTLAAVGTPGTYNSLVTDAKGRVVSGTMLPYLLANQSINVSGDATGSGSSAIVLTLAASGVTAGSYALAGIVVDSRGRVTSASAGSIAQTISATGDATGSASITGTSGTYALALSLVATGTPGTFSQVATDAKGRVTGGANPTSTVTLAGDVAGSSSTVVGGTASISTTLASIGTPGTYNQVIVDAKGRVTVGSFLPYTTSNQPITISGDASGFGTTTIALTLASVAAAGTYDQVVISAKGLATSGTSPTTTITVSGDVSGTASFLNGSTVALATTLASVGTAGTYIKVVTDVKGRITAGTTLVASDITAGLGYTPVNKAGDTITGTLAINGTTTCTGTVTAPTVAASDNSANVATTAMVQAVAVGRTPPGWRNALLNGGFTINQRGITSGQTIGGGAFFADRWRYTNVNGGTRSYGVIAATDAVRAALSDEAVTYIATATFAGTSGTGDYELIYQNTEDPRRLAGKTVIVSGWAYNTGTSALNFAVELTQNFGSGGTPSAEVDSIGCTKFTVPATTWTRFATAPITIPTLQGKVLGTNGDAIMQSILWLSAGSTFSTSRAAGVGVQSGTLQFANLQIEQVLPGVTLPTPFEYRPLEAELMLCRRFFQGAKQYSATSYSTAGSMSVALSVPYSPTMRVFPAVSTTNVANGNLGSMTAAILPGDVVYFSGLSTAAGATSFNQTFMLSADL